MVKIGYARVSTLKQDLNEKISELEKFGCKKSFQVSIQAKPKKTKSSSMSCLIIFERAIRLLSQNLIG